MRILKYELYKIFHKKSIILALILLSIIDIYKINYCFKNDNIVTNEYNIGKQYSTAYWSLHDKISGPITTDKINFIKNTYKNAKQIVESGNYSTEPNQPNTYTGYIFGDMNMFKDFYDALDYCYNYGNNLKESIAKAQSNVEFYKEHKNEFEVRNNKKIIDTYSNRNISKFYDTLAYKEFFNYDFSSLLIICILALGLSSVFSSEKETGMNPLLLSTKHGKNTVISMKVLASIIFIISISTYFFIVDFIGFSVIFNLSGSSLPLYAMSDFQSTPLNISIWQFVIYSDLIKILGFLSIGALIVLFSSIFSESILPFILSTGAISTFLFSNDFLSKNQNPILTTINPIILITNRDLFRRYNALNIFGYPILQSSISLGFIIVFFSLLIFITIMLNRKNIFISRLKVSSYLSNLRKGLLNI